MRALFWLLLLFVSAVTLALLAGNNQVMLTMYLPPNTAIDFSLNFALAAIICTFAIRCFIIAAGWFITKNVLFKAEYVTQQYDGFPVAFTNYAAAGGYQDSSIFHKAKFDGFVIQGVISF